MSEQSPVRRTTTIESSEGLHSYFYLARQCAAETAENEQLTYSETKDERDKFPWPTYQSPLASYSKTFANVLMDTPGTASHSIARWLQERHKTHPQLHILDFMGQGRFYKDHEAGPTISKELAVTLVDFSHDTSGNISTIENDVLKGQTWRSIEEFLKEQTAPGFDLILCRPIAGWNTLFPVSHKHFVEEISLLILRRLIQQLHPQGGILLVHGFSTLYTAASKIINATPGLHLDIDKENAFWTAKIRRTSADKIRY